MPPSLSILDFGCRIFDFEELNFTECPTDESEVANPKSQIQNLKFQLPGSQVSQITFESEVANPKSKIRNLKSEMTALKRELLELKQEKADLEILLDATAEHSDSVEIEAIINFLA